MICLRCKMNVPDSQSGYCAMCAEIMAKAFGKINYALDSLQSKRPESLGEDERSE